MKEHPKASIGDVKNFLSSIDNREDFEKAVSDFIDGAETQHFLDEKTGGNASTYINYYADEIRREKGWGRDSSTTTVGEEDSSTVQTIDAYYAGSNGETSAEAATSITKSWVDENKGQTVTAKQISDYLKTVNDIETAAKELQEAYEKREFEFNAQGISFKQCLNNIVSSLMELRRKGKI